MKRLNKNHALIALLFMATIFLFPINLCAQTVDDIKGPVCVLHDSITNKSFTLSPERSLYNVVVTDGLAHITLVQLYVNKFGHIKDMVYVFPLPNSGSVHSMSMEYRDSVYVAKIYEKSTAFHLYDSVVAAGGNGALLLQDRPNIFQQHLANIAMGDSAYVTIGISVPLKYNNGTYELAIPTMIGERYQSAGQSFVPSGPFWNPPENREGQSLQINVLIQTGFPIVNLESPTHPISNGDLPAMRKTLQDRGVLSSASTFDEASTLGAVLLSQQTYPNRDYVLRFSRKEATQDFSIASYFDQTKKTGYFAMNIFPDTSLFKGQRPDLDIVLLVDYSGSQDGWPLIAEKKVALSLLTRLKTTDKISVLAFNDATTWGFGNSNPVEASTANCATAATFINSLTASGGTNLLGGVQAALAAPQTPKHTRYYIFLTDGFVTNETEILAAIKNDPSQPTVFTFGCGDNINRYLIDGAAATGNGGYGTVITQLEATESIEPFVDDAWQKIESPQLKNITVDFGTIGARNILMPSGTNLFIGRPVEIYGKYVSGAASMVTVTGTVSDKIMTIKKNVEFTGSENMNYMVPLVWARQYIEYLSQDQGITDKNKSKIIEVSTEYQVLSQYTAFLAINPQKLQPDASAGQQISKAFTDIREQPKAHDFKAMLRGFFANILNGILKVVLPQNTFLEKMSVYELNGRLVYSLNCSVAAHIQTINWDGKLANGRSIKSGMYILNLKTTTGMLSTQLLWK